VGLDSFAHLGPRRIAHHLVQRREGTSQEKTCCLYLIGYLQDSDGGFEILLDGYASVAVVKAERRKISKPGLSNSGLEPW
jgi:hypothetical protein